nr:hypothetical protein [Streptomyces montanus]
METRPLLVAVLEPHRDLFGAPIEGAQRITAGTLHGGKPLIVHKYRDSRLQQGVESDSPSFLVVVVLHEGVVTQEYRRESIEVLPDRIRRNSDDSRPFLSLPAVLGIGEKILETVDVTDARLARTAVQSWPVALLQAASRSLGTDLGVLAEAAPLVEERIERRNARGDGLHQEEAVGLRAATEDQ